MSRDKFMTKEFKNEAILMLKVSYPFADERQILEIAKVLWELMPRIYNPAANDEK